MKIFKKTESKKQETNTIRELTKTELKVVGGGINPQPLPPIHGGEMKL
jgi:hypothetical protein